PSGTCNGTINKPTGYNADTIGGGVVDCWKALLQLKPCTKEFRKFFSNGYVGPHCCPSQAKYWLATMITSLGFAPKQANLLRDY
ncbi:hypothetical protein CISIN_1g047578mg, partial [Citrus sinensis]